MEILMPPPGWGLDTVACKPAARPNNIPEILLVAAFDIFSVFTVAIEVVRFLRESYHIPPLHLI
jgi:hypothetical protein